MSGQIQGRLAYYPGCCGARGEGRAYTRAALACCSRLGLEVVELKGWNCCGGPELAEECPVGSAALSVRNIGLAARLDAEILAICPACVGVMRKGVRLIDQQPGLAEQAAAGLAEMGLGLPGNRRVHHLIGVLAEGVEAGKSGEQVGRPLTGVPLACYYGCSRAEWASAGRGNGKAGPIETLMRGLGAEVVEWKQPEGCCEDPMSGGKHHAPEAVLTEAAQADAECVSVACPRCALALQRAALKSGPQPAFFAQFVAGALGVPMGQAGLRISKGRKRAIVRMRRKQSGAIA